MASQSESPLSAQLVGNAFVHQYYHVLHQSPEEVYRFYQERSKLGRPESQRGAMSSVTTMPLINEKILSMNYGDYRAEIKTIDAQESLNGGVIVLVTGCLTGQDNVRRDFTQSFFLATQDNGYFVLNDIFRYVNEADTLQESHDLANSADAGDSHEQGTVQPQELGVNADISIPHAGEEEEEEEEEEKEEEVVEKEEGVNEGEVCNPSDSEDGSVVEDEAQVNDVPNEIELVADRITAILPEDAPKKSYASIVKVPVSVSAPSSSHKPAPPITVRQAAPVPAPEFHAASSNSTESSSIQEAEVDGHSIYIKNLPLNATPSQLEEEFKKFGPIKNDGIQVRSHKQQGFCFGFVEFEDAPSVQSAIEASPIMIGGRPAYVEEKRPTGSRAGTRGRFAPVRGSGGFRNDGMRGRGGYGSGRGYGRGDFNNRAEYGGRGSGRGGYSGRGGEVGYRMIDHTESSRGRGGRSGSLTSPRGIAASVPASA